MTFQTEMDKLASAIAAKAMTAEIEQSTDAMKALTAYYIARFKVTAKGDDDEDDTNFTNFGAAINGAPAENASGKPVPGRRRTS